MKKTIEVTQEVQIEYDPARFTPEFMKAFSEAMYEFDNIDGHLEHIAQCCARGIIDGKHSFLEGYGVLSEFGISKLRISSTETWVN